jgi:hypothetical protein
MLENYRVAAQLVASRVVLITTEIIIIIIIIIFTLDFMLCVSTNGGAEERV